MKQLQLNYLHELFTLRSDGTLVFKSKRHKNPVGTPVGHCNAEGYLRVMIDGRAYLVHRIVYAMVNGQWPQGAIDHIDGQKSNNAPENLRAASSAQNCRNRRVANKNNTSGYPGVFWDKVRGKWHVLIGCDWRLRSFGRWEDLELAAFIAEEARRKLFGEFAPGAV